MTDEWKPDSNPRMLEAEILIHKQIIVMLEHLSEMHIKIDALYRELNERVTEE